MKHLLLTTIAAVVLVGCGRSKGEHLFYAALEGRTKDVQICLDNGANTDAEIWLLKELPWDKGFGSATPLHVAQTKEIAQLLITQGASIEAIVKGNESAGFGKNGRYSYAFFSGDTPLHTHAGEGRKEVVEILINAGANVNAKNDTGMSPLHNAVTKEVVELLIAEGADVNAKNKHGGTPLHEAAASGHKEIVELLIAEGADVNAKDVNGYTPLDWAIFNKDTETADLLRKHGGKTGEELKAEGK